MPDLALAFLAVSVLSLGFQAAALTRLTARRGEAPAERLAAAGYRRTVACRVAVVAVYVTIAAVQAAGDGALSAEALAVFTGIQVLWWANSLADIRVRRALATAGGAVPDKPRDQLAAIAEVTGDLDAVLDKLFANVAELKVILARAAEGKGEQP